jgi:hypothetical protein
VAVTATVTRAMAVIAVLVLSACSARPNCSPDTCSGCCTGVGTCERGDTQALCGTGANICATCSVGRTCSSGSCVPAGAGGGSQTGGGGGQTGPGCVTIARFNEDSAASTGFFSTGPPPAVSAWVFDPPIGPTYDWLNITQRYPGGIPAAPYQGSLQPGGMRACNDCVTYSPGCMGSMVMPGCPTTFFAQSGTLEIDQLSVSPGTYSGAAANLHLVEWDFAGDVPLAGGRCIDLVSATFNVHWQ